jgi:SAM-dependent methyltransferase
MKKHKQYGPTSKGFKRNLKKIARILRVKPLYQQERQGVFEQRWSSIAQELDASDASLLDIGCNMGAFTAMAAQRGLFAIGVDPMEEAIARARRTHRKISGCGFAYMDVNLETVQRLPKADVILALSVHHYWNRAHGEAGAWTIIAELLKRSGKLFFEPASSHARYGEDTPDFIENNVDSIDAYVTKGFARIAPRHIVRRISTTDSINTEQFRSMYLVTSA